LKQELKKAIRTLRSRKKKRTKILILKKLLYYGSMCSSLNQEIWTQECPMRVLSVLLYVLSVLFLALWLFLFVNEDARHRLFSDNLSMTVIYGILCQPMLFFLLGREASRLAKAQKQEQIYLLPFAQEETSGFQRVLSVLLYASSVQLLPNVFTAIVGADLYSGTLSTATTREIGTVFGSLCPPMLCFLLGRESSKGMTALDKTQNLSVLWYTLSVLNLADALYMIMNESARHKYISGDPAIGFVIGALLPSVFFFWLGRKASKRMTALDKAHKPGQFSPQA
jgi:hypothetical protein